MSDGLSDSFRCSYVLCTQFGSARPWNFCCKRSFWTGEVAVGSYDLLPQPETAQMVLSVDTDSSIFEAVSEEVGRREHISIQRLRKVRRWCSNFLVLVDVSSRLNLH
jgi:hypothetical protein